MSDVIETPQVDEASAVEGENGKPADVAELNKQLEEMQKRFNGMQRILSERDKEKAELARQAEEEKRSKMSEIEKLREDFQRQQDETAKWMREARIKENTMKARDEISKLGLPMSTLEIMDVSSDEALAASLQRVSKFAEELKQTVSRDFATKHGQAPPKTGGGILSGDEKAQVAALRKAGDLQQATRLAIKNAIKTTN